MTSLFDNYDEFGDHQLEDRQGFFNEVDDAVATEDIRRMAETLAPQMTELEDVLKDISTTEEGVTDALELAESTNQSMIEEDDDLDDELQQLAMSEQALREELEFAQDMNNRLSVMYTPEKETPEEEAAAPTTNGDVPPSTYSLQDHAAYLQIKTEKSGGWYYCDMSQYVPSQKDHTSEMLVKDYCLPIPYRKLKRIYSGLVYHQVAHHTNTGATPRKTTTGTPMKGQSTPGSRGSTTGMHTPTREPSSSNAPSTPDHAAPPPPPPKPQEEPLPVRTVALRIRSDVLCGAVMDAVHHAFESMPASVATHVLKRQGGHLRGGVYIPDKALAYVVDVQLCTQKGEELERRLVVRFYHIQDDQDAMSELTMALQQRIPPSPGLEGAAVSQEEVAESTIVNRHMKQSCSLVQRLMAAQQKGGVKDMKEQLSWLGLQDTAYQSMSDMQSRVANHLESNFKTCPSVREENKKPSPTIRKLTLPSLSVKDWPLLEVSWGLTRSIVSELETRECTFNTLENLPFGQFPSLPTLDVHYCSQLRRLSREAMITQLLKSAKDLEDYARGAEYNCAVCITFLEPMLGHYDIPPLDTPKADKPLQEYDLDYTPPQVACPPWGNLVMQALNQIAAKTPTGEIDEATAVRMVFDAFVRQDDEEQAARLGRKNAQIMERLVALQAHQRSLVQNIRDSHVYSEKASHDAAVFLKHAEKAVNAGKEGFPRSLQPEVPLMSFRVSLGASSSGTCFVTANQMLFATTYIPLLSSTKTTLFDLSSIAFQVDESVPSTLLNPFPNTVKVVVRNSGNCVFQFRPSVGPTRLQKFLTVIQSFAGEEVPSEFSQVVDNLQALEEDGSMRLADAQTDDLSI